MVFLVPRSMWTKSSLLRDTWMVFVIEHITLSFSFHFPLIPDENIDCTSIFDGYRQVKKKKEKAACILIYVLLKMNRMIRVSTRMRKKRQQIIIDHLLPYFQILQNFQISFGIMQKIQNLLIGVKSALVQKATQHAYVKNKCESEASTL